MSVNLICCDSRKRRGTYKRLIPIPKKALYKPRFKEDWYDEDLETANIIRRRSRLREFLYNGA